MTAAGMREGEGNISLGFIVIIGRREGRGVKVGLFGWVGGHTA